MIHLIYIYFIVNAFYCGISLGKNEKWYYVLLMLLFGLPFFAICFISYLFIETIGVLYRKSLIKGWYRLYFTEYFAKMDDVTLKIRKQQYHNDYMGDRKHMNSRWYGRFFLRQIDKKYNYGITK